jgi:glycosyltransferase involved in cell wall biosynthesis
VGAQVQAVRDVLSARGIVHEILVVDDGSEDCTADEAVQAGARVLQHVENRGYGAAIKSGIRAAKYEVVVIIDADGTYPATEIPNLLALLETADMVVGARTGQRVQVPWMRRPAKWMLRRLAVHITGHSIPDLNSGLRAFRRECMVQYFSILSDRFSFTTTSTISLLADNYRVVYHPIDYYQRIGRSKITPWHFMDFTILILRMSMMFEPLKIFVPLSLSFILLGVLKMVYDMATVFARHSGVDWTLLYQPVLSTSAILMLFVGIQLLLIGMVADGLLRRFTQHNRPLVRSRGILVPELSAGVDCERREATLEGEKVEFHGGAE